MGRKRRSIEEDEEEEEQVDLEEEEEEQEADGDNNDEDAGEEPDEEAEDQDAAEDDEEVQEEEQNQPSPPKRRRKESSPPRSAPRPLNAPGGLAQVGIVHSIYVENFMCHRKLRVDLNRNINFIHGQNGSGKSAILAALQICLGAGARRTHRARNLKALVRQDPNNQPTQAKIRVTVLNQGEDAFRHELYGDKITVERTVALKAGYNGYKMYDASMKEVSRSRKDLDDMLDHLNIQVENPVAILDQEEAKKFLTGKAEDKYKFFMKACELERLDNSYAHTVDKLDECENTKNRLGASLETERMKVSELKAKYEEHCQVEKLEKKFQTDKVKLGWAMWQAINEDHEKAKKDMESFEERAAKKREELSQAESLSQESSGGQDELSSRLAELVQETQICNDQRLKLHEELKVAKAPFRDAEQRAKRFESKEKQARNELKAAQQRLNEARQEIASQNKESEEAQLAAKQVQLEEALAAAREKDEPLRQDVADKLQAYEELEPNVREAAKQSQEKQRALEWAQKGLKELENSSGDPLAVYGGKVKAVKAAIEAHKRSFQGPVEGPIGVYLKITPGMDEYAELAELHLGKGTLDRFIVTNDHDRKLLNKIRRDKGCRNECGIFQVTPGARYAVPPPPVNTVQTVASVLKIESDLVFNCLVDNCKIDQTALARDRQKSESELITNRNGSKALKGIIKMVYCLPKGDFWTIRNGQQSINSNEKRLVRTIGNDQSAAIAQRKREIEQLEAEVKEFRREDNRLNIEHSELQKLWNMAKRQLSKNQTEIERLVDEIDKVKNDIISCATYTIDTTEYEEDVAQQTENVQKFAQEKEKANEDLENLKAPIDEIQAKLKQVDAEINKYSRQIQEAEEAVTKYVETQSQRKDAVERKREKMKKYEEVIRKHNEKLDKLREEEERMLKSARKMHFRCLQSKKSDSDVEPRTSLGGDDDISEPTPEDLEEIEPVRQEKTVDHLQARVQRNKEKLEKEKQKRKLTGEDPAEAFEKYTQAKQNIVQKMAEIEKLEETLANYRSDLKERRKRWKQFRRLLSDKTSEKFQDLLSINKYKGELKFDHEDGSLDLMVQKANSGSTAQSSDVKGLSGGERSYTTISLLLALGESLETPFRVMDEFDVFLDPQVRKLTIKALIATAKQMNHRQFIFITPQDLTGIDQDPQLKIFKLHPPERYNTVGPSQQTLNLSQA